MSRFNVPTKSEVSENNQAIFDQLEKKLGFVPNLYAYYAKNDTALGDYLTFSGRKSSLKAKEQEVINLVASELNACTYCLSAHTALGKMNGFTDEQILEIRGGSASFDPKLDALVKLSASIVENQGNATADTKEAFFAAGYEESHLVDVVLAIGTKIISNYLHNITQIAVDFPAVPSLETANA
ncbi:MAG: carboxymuconolactone decarboxylase family protein [Bacteroidota bacterium]